MITKTLQTHNIQHSISGLDIQSLHMIYYHHLFTYCLATAKSTQLQHLNTKITKLHMHIAVSRSQEIVIK